MFGRKQKLTLSQTLQMGVAGPSSQSTFFKVGGVFFLVLSLGLIANIFSNIKASQKAPEIATKSQPSQVLGAFDKRTPDQIASTPETYTVAKGDTLFNIAQSHNINWVVIATLNNLKAPYNLKPGTVLKLR